MEISSILTPDDELRLKSKIEQEFTLADNHTKNWKTDVMDINKEYLFAKPDEDRVKIRKIWNNLTIRKSIFLWDELQVTNIPMNWVLGQEVADNCNKVFEANFKTMNIRQKYEEVLDDDALTGVWVLAVDGWNNHSQEPIVSYIDSRLTYPDPKNWIGNNMRFFWTLLRKSLYELKADEAYDTERICKLEISKSTEIDRVDRANNNVKGFTYTDDDSKDSVDIYNHITIFKGSEDEENNLYLVTLDNARDTILRVVKMRALTENEKADPSKISLWVQLFRGKPIKWSYAWASLVDEIGQYQDLETLLTNLQIQQAKVAALGGKTYIDGRLGLDIDAVASESAAWDIIPFTSTDSNINAVNWIYQEPVKPTNPITSNTIQLMNQLTDEATNMGSLVQWQSLSGSQTKAEVQTLQQNINQIISLMSSNYMESLKWLWEDVYKSYAANMSPQRKKCIVVVDDNNKTNSYWFKKKEFIDDTGELYILVKSKSQENTKKKQDFAVLLSVIWTLKQSVKPWSTQDIIINRMLVEKSGIRGLEAETIHPLTRDEREAYDNVELLNLDVELKTKPEAWEDHNVFIQIYKTGLDTKARDNAIALREEILRAEWEPVEMEEEAKGGWVAQQLGASMLAQEQSTAPSISDVSA